jgi:ferredoxin/flavodoxin
LKIDSVKLVTFSPTGNSKKVSEAIAKAIQATIEYVDLTSPSARTRKFEEFNGELAIITSPVYLGRVPFEAAHRIRRLKANNTPTVLVVTYGNRAYEDALRELNDIVSEVGFKPIAACVFIGEHSWSTLDMPTAHGRPDAEDLAKANNFGLKILEKYKGVDNIEDLSPVKTPGKNPYTLRASVYTVRELVGPRTDEELCTKCGTCAEVCPTSAITIKHLISNLSPRASLNTLLVSTDEEACIWCCACVRSCPTGARVRRPRILEDSESLNKNYPERKEPETYL